MRESRKNRVIKALELNESVRHNQKALCVAVWKLEGCQTLDDVLNRGSSPSGILRDRRRTHVLERFPRDEEKEKHFKSYTDEFSGFVAAEIKEPSKCNSCGVMVSKPGKCWACF